MKLAFREPAAALPLRFAGGLGSYLKIGRELFEAGIERRDLAGEEGKDWSSDAFAQLEHRLLIPGLRECKGAGAKRVAPDQPTGRVKVLDLGV